MYWIGNWVGSYPMCYFISRYWYWYIRGDWVRFWLIQYTIRDWTLGKFRAQGVRHSALLWTGLPPHYIITDTEALFRIMEKQAFVCYLLEAKLWHRKQGWNLFLLTSQPPKWRTFELKINKIPLSLLQFAIYMASLECRHFLGMTHNSRYINNNPVCENICLKQGLHNGGTPLCDSACLLCLSCT